MSSQSEIRSLIEKRDEAYAQWQSSGGYESYSNECYRNYMEIIDEIVEAVENCSGLDLSEFGL
jgi:hypothetical protein